MAIPFARTGCLNCGKDDMNVGTEKVALVRLDANDNLDASGGMGVYSLTCLNCGFVALFDDKIAPDFRKTLRS